MGETLLEPDPQSYYFVESPHNPWEVINNNNNDGQYYGTFCVSGTVPPVRDHYCPHFTDEETETRQGAALPLWCSVFPHHIHVQSCT